MDKVALTKANEGGRKVLFWIVTSGVMTTVLTAILALLAQVENGDLDWRKFFSRVGILLVNGLLNVGLYWAAKYKEGNV